LLTTGYAALGVSMNSQLERDQGFVLTVGVLAGFIALPLEVVERVLLSRLPASRRWGWALCLGVAYVALLGAVVLAAYAVYVFETGQLLTGDLVAGPLRPLLDGMGQNVPRQTVALLWILAGPAVAFAAAADSRLARAAGETGRLPGSTVVVFVVTAVVLGGSLGWIRSTLEPWLGWPAAIYGMGFQLVWGTIWFGPLLSMADLLRDYAARLR
jgi:hypothetical protein